MIQARVSSSVSRYASFASLIGISLLMIAGGFFYPGGGAIYAAFCMLFLLVFMAIPYGRFSWVYTGLAVFWALGYPIKLIMHLLSKQYYLEPVGYFDYSSTHYDHALLVAICGACGLLLVKILPTEKFLINPQSKPLKILANPSRLEVTFYICTLLTLSVTNMHLEIFRVGLSSQTVFPYKLTSLVFWFFNLGIPVWLTFILWRSSCEREKEIDEMVGLIIISAFIVAITILSRAPFVFFAAPLLFVLLRRATKETSLSLKRIGAYLVVYCLMFAVSIVTVSFSRSNAYQSDVAASPAPAPAKAPAPDRTIYLTQTSSLFVDRWIGFEGVAAVSAFPRKGWELMQNALTESPTLGSAGMYQHIAKSPFATTYKGYLERKILGTEPGLIGFLYYSDRLWFVGMLVWVIVSLAIMIERVASYVTGENPYFVAFIGVTLANMIMQFVNPIAHMKVAIEILGTIALSGFLVNRYYAVREK